MREVNFLDISILFSFPMAIELVDHSPTPSSVIIAALLNGDGEESACCV
jgi:hypothetical protein